jgi:hypothetical protein
LHADPTVYTTMVGASEKNPTGTLRDLNITSAWATSEPRRSSCPGGTTRVPPPVVQPLAQGIPGAKWAIFEEVQPQPHIEQKAEYLPVLREFLAGHDR